MLAGFDLFEFMGLRRALKPFLVPKFGRDDSFSPFMTVPGLVHGLL